MLTESQARALGVQLRRDLKDGDVGCPAGTCSGGRAVYCGIECHLIEAAHEPSTIMRYCAGDYTQCPTWRAEKERAWAREALVEG